MYRLCVALLCLASLPSGVEAQEPASTFGEAVDVRVVNIDVFVTDKKGRRVSGLERDDFIVYQDGRQVELTNFSRVTAPGQDRGSDRLASLDTDLDSEPLAALDETSTLVIYVDNSTLTPHHRNRVLDELETFVRGQGAGLNTMVVAYNPGLEILAEPTQEIETVAAAIRSLGDMPARGLNAIADRRQAMEQIQSIYDLYANASLGGEPVGASPGEGGRGAGGFDPCTDGWESMIAAVDSYSQTATHRIGAAQSGLLGLVRSLGGVPGRKALLYLSDGLEQRPGIDLYNYLGEICTEREREMIGYMTRWDETRLLEEVADYANAHRVTLYALETTGLRTPSIASVEFGDKRFTPSTRNDNLRVSNLQNSLFIMADQTGGQAFFNANQPDTELERVAADFSDYYSLGFRPPHGWDGQTHRIRVELGESAPKGARLRYRQRYRAIPEEERLAERTLAALVLGWEENPLSTRVEIGEPKPAADGTWQVPVEIVLPRSGLGVLGGSAGQRQLVRVLMIAEDERGRRSAMREKVIPILLASEQISVDDVSRVVVDLMLAEGDHRVAIGVHDELNRVASFHRAEIVVAESVPQS